jgi:superfamily I DNA/RNA helicase
MTIYQAKGLQADVVCLVNAIDESFTQFGSVADGVRRLYVAATRARTQLNISAPRWIRYTALGHAVRARFRRAS